MPRKHGKPQEQISYHCPPEILKRIEDSVKEGGYSSRSDFITVAIRFYFENKDAGIDSSVRKYLASEEGKQFIKDLLQKIKAD
jgi:Arc/MetJ-type ribon-helix-helix transcriptional regulator